MYGLLATALGWTFSEIDQHTLHDVAALNRHWASSPPMHISIARIVSAFGGSRTSDGSSGRGQTRRTKESSDADMEREREMLKALAGQFGHIRQGAAAI